MRHLTAAISWLLIASVAALAFTLIPACPYTDPSLLESEAIPGAASGPTMREAVVLMGGSIERCTEP